MRQILFKELLPILNQATAYKPKWFVIVLTVFRVLFVTSSRNTVSLRLIRKTAAGVIAVTEYLKS